MEYRNLGDVLVMGSSGLLGSALVDLLRQGYGHARTVSGFDIADNRHRDIDYYRGDITDINDVERAVSGKDVVFNTVAVVSFNPKQNARMTAINVDGAMNVLRACDAGSVSKLIYTSTMDVVFGGKPIVDGDERLPYPAQYLDFYSHTKRVAEERLLGANRQTALCLLRATGLYGPNDSIRFPAIVEAVRAGKYAVFGRRDTRYSHLYAHNCAHAHILAAGRLEAGNELDGSIYFIVDDSTLNFFDFVERVLAAAGLEPTPKTIPGWLAKVLAALSEWWIGMPWTEASASPMISRLGVSMLTQDVWFRGDKAKRDFGYEPLFSLEAAIEDTAKWIRRSYLD